MSKIEWTDRSDWNPVRGCTRVSPGCGGPGDHGGCYAEGMAARFSLSAAEVEAKWRADPSNAGKVPPVFKDQWGHGVAEMQNGKPRWTGKVALQEDRLTLPLSWRKPVRIFVNSTSDIFHEALPDEAIDKVFAVMALCPQHTFQVLTKRAERMQEYLSQKDTGHRLQSTKWFVENPPRIQEMLPWPLPNVWLGVSAERQEEWDERTEHLGNTPAAVRFVSAEPLLGNIVGKPETMLALDWLIVGGESGPKARPMHPDWARSLRDQCAAAGVAFFFKQWGEWREPSQHEWFDTSKGRAGSPPAFIVAHDGTVHCFQNSHTLAPYAKPATVVRVGKKAAGRLLGGVEHNAFPEAPAS